MKIGWVDERRFLDHDTGPSHPERADRLRVIQQAIQRSGLATRLEKLACRPATVEQLTRVHDPAYVEIVRMLCDEQFTFIGTQDTCICSHSYDVAVLAVGGVLAACDAVMAGRVRRAFCLVRPPGHHAESDQAMGYCLFNNVALGAMHLLQFHDIKRVAIVDFDAHHGNGTQHIFEDCPAVLYASLHERPGSLPFPGTGESVETGHGAGAGFTVNVPLDRGAGEVEFLTALQQKVLPALESFHPEFLLFSAGFDALMHDRASHLALRPTSYETITEPLVRVAERHAGGRVVSVLEGGYDLAELGAAAVAHVRALLQD